MKLMKLRPIRRLAKAAALYFILLSVPSSASFGASQYEFIVPRSDLPPMDCEGDACRAVHVRDGGPTCNNLGKSQELANVSPRKVQITGIMRRVLKNGTTYIGDEPYIFPQSVTLDAGHV